MLWMCDLPLQSLLWTHWKIAEVATAICSRRISLRIFGQWLAKEVLPTLRDKHHYHCVDLLVVCPWHIIHVHRFNLWVGYA